MRNPLSDIYGNKYSVIQWSTTLTAKLILLTDIYNMRRRKEEELAFYHAELEKLMSKLKIVQHEISVTNKIIEIIEQERVIDIAEIVKNKSSQD